MNDLIREIVNSLDLVTKIILNRRYGQINTTFATFDTTHKIDEFVVFIFRRIRLIDFCPNAFDSSPSLYTRIRICALSRPNF